LTCQIAQGVTRVAVNREPSIAAGIGQLGAIRSVAPAFGVELTPVNERDVVEFERVIAAFAKLPPVFSVRGAATIQSAF